MTHYLRNYNDHTRHLTDEDLRRAEDRAHKRDMEFQRGEGHGQGDWETFFNDEVRKLRFGK